MQYAEPLPRLVEQQILAASGMILTCFMSPTRETWLGARSMDDSGLQQ